LAVLRRYQHVFALNLVSINMGRQDGKIFFRKKAIFLNFRVDTLRFPSL